MKREFTVVIFDAPSRMLLIASIKENFKAYKVNEIHEYDNMAGIETSDRQQILLKEIHVFLFQVSTIIYAH